MIHGSSVFSRPVLTSRADRANRDTIGAGFYLQNQFARPLGR